jgi:hypothetical protein
MVARPLSSISEERLHHLLEEGFLPTSCEARAPQDYRAPSLLVGEAISVAAFHERGLSLMASIFLQGLVAFYNLELHHLSPDKILHVAMFQTLCEAFLGILPHFVLWRHFSQLRVDNGPLPLIGGVTLEQRSGRARKYV